MARLSRVEQALNDAGAVLVRSRNHLVFRLPNGQTFVLATTASDHRAEQNNLARLRRLLNTPPRTRIKDQSR